jgi:predicted O-methyltransferase YrrM
MEFEQVESTLMNLHECLKKLSIENKEDHDGLEGNIYTYDGMNTVERMKDKMINLFYLAKECTNDILEIGFNAGNSSLIFLLANPNVKIHAIDLCCHAYVQPCVDFLNELFNNRVILYRGDSLQIVPELDRSLSDTISLYHIDGYHALEGIQGDMKNCYDLAKNGAFLVVDDVHIVDILNEAKKYESDNKIILLPQKILKTPECFPHLICSYNK